jgi:hypothetical protein
MNRHRPFLRVPWIPLKRACRLPHYLSDHRLPIRVQRVSHEATRDQSHG